MCLKFKSKSITKKVPQNKYFDHFLTMKLAKDKARAMAIASNTSNSAVIT